MVKDREDKWDVAQYRRAITNMANDHSSAFDDRDKCYKNKSGPAIATASGSAYTNVTAAGTANLTFTFTNIPIYGVLRTVYIEQSGDSTDCDFRVDSKSSPGFFDMITSAVNVGTRYMDVFSVPYTNTDATATSQIYMTITASFTGAGSATYNAKVIVEQAGKSWLWT